MKKVEECPPPDWVSVVITWDDIFNGPTFPIREILNWIDLAPGGDYHLSGLDDTQGFDFRFRTPADATYFRLKWAI